MFNLEPLGWTKRGNVLESQEPNPRKGLSFLLSLDEDEEINRVNKQAWYIPSLIFNVHKGMGILKGFLWTTRVKTNWKRRVS
jgi:hypothetical protein